MAVKKEVITFKNVSKKFKKGRKLLLKEALLDIFKPEKTDHFWALKNLNFTINKGESVGIIGANGSGKSTILKLIAGVMFPDKGWVTVNGRIAPLIELGAGFHPELTGRENIFLNGAILGMGKKEINEEYESIVNFSGIREFIDTPVKHYSSGMYMRLAFSIAIHTKPDILLVDEILAVGDEKFQKKCLKTMNLFKEAGITTVFVSHNLPLVASFCDRIILLKQGELQKAGSPSDIIRDFLK